MFNSPILDLNLRFGILIWKLKCKFRLKRVGLSSFETHFEHVKIEDPNANRDEMAHFSELRQIAMLKRKLR